VCRSPQGIPVPVSIRAPQWYDPVVRLPMTQKRESDYRVVLVLRRLIVSELAVNDKRNNFIAQLRDGRSATLAVQEITGVMPEIVTIASHDDPVMYIRYGVMMAGPMMAAITILKLDQHSIPSELMERIKNGEPCGGVLGELSRRCAVIEHGIAVHAMASLAWYGTFIGNAQEVFTESLLK
jgi:hypothetical protein